MTPEDRHTHADTDMHTHMHMEAHINTYIHADTHKHTYTCRHTYILIDVHMPTGQRGYSLTKNRWPSCPTFPPHTLVHTFLHWLVFIAHPLDAYLTPWLWSETSCGPQGPAQLGSSRSQGWLQAWMGWGGQAGRWRGITSASRRQAGSRGPSWRAACGHTWLNRDNSGCSPSPASFPLAQPQIHGCPEPLLPRGQLQGIHRDGRGAEGPGAPGE